MHTTFGTTFSSFYRFILLGLSFLSSKPIQNHIASKTIKTTLLAAHVVNSVTIIVTKILKINFISSALMHTNSMKSPQRDIRGNRGCLPFTTNSRKFLSGCKYMVNVFLVRPTGKFPGQTEIPKSYSSFPGSDVPNGSSFTIYISVNSSCAQRPPYPLADPQALAFFCLG